MMLRMRRARARSLVVVGLLVGTSGCQAFVGIDDAQQHLPALNGNYLVAVARPRPSNPATTDVVSMIGTATLDLETRTLDLSMSILPFGGGTPLSETSISDIEFPFDNDETNYELKINIPMGALNPNPPPNDSDDLQFDADVIFVAEDDFAFCARPLDPQEEMPSMGSILVENFTMLPANTDSDCDDRDQ
jgi:hypothetical protein